MTTIEWPGEGVDAIRSDAGLVRLRSITEGDTAQSCVHKQTRPNGYDHHGLAAQVRRGADVLPENTSMTEVLRHLGYPMHMDTDHGTAEIVFDISPSRAVGPTTEARERSADVASLSTALAPRSIAVVVGPGRPSPTEQLLLDNLIGAGFTGEVHTVGPDRGLAARVPSVSALTQLPAPPDMAIILGAEKDVVAEIDRCGLAGVQTVVLPHRRKHPGVGSGDAPQGRRELAAARRYGMRLLGPGCAGVVNTNPDVRLNATLVTAPMRAGGLGLLAQSGELGLAVMLAAASRGLGMSQFVALGDRLDVSEDDLLQRWAADPDTTVIALVLDDLVDPARFAATVRHVADHTPILAYVPPDPFGRARDLPGRAGPGAVRAVLRGCGVRVMSTTQELIDTAQTLARRPPTEPPTSEQPTSEQAAVAAHIGTGERADLRDVPGLLDKYGIAYQPDDSQRGVGIARVATIVVAARRDQNYGGLIRVERTDDTRPESEDLALAPLCVHDAEDLVRRTIRGRSLDGRPALSAAGQTPPADLLVRMASLVDHVQEITELELVLRPEDPSVVCHVSVRSGVRTTGPTSLLRP